MRVSTLSDIIAALALPFSLIEREWGRDYSGNEENSGSSALVSDNFIYLIVSEGELLLQSKVHSISRFQF